MPVHILSYGLCYAMCDNMMTMMMCILPMVMRTALSHSLPPAVLCFKKEHCADSSLFLLVLLLLLVGGIVKEK